MKVLESAENYLEAILMIREEKGMVRAIDIVNHLGFSKPSVSVAMKHLETDDLIRRDKDGFIFLTDSGEEIAEMIFERHNLLTDIFVKIGVDPETAREDACKIEHDLSEETFEHIKRAYTAHKDKYI
ncbi:MAG: metal-dependent transcriptional regulator [Clostridiales bacterium]|nr:metal-dependent transcriptional regulator [Clostridiales bacterium]MBQ3321999.1 metal-dependent transcriptional regulator [Bacillota bacterium]